MNKALRELVEGLADRELADRITTAANAPVRMDMKGGMIVVDGKVYIGERSSNGTFQVPGTDHRMDVLAVLDFGNQGLAETVAQSTVVAMSLFAALDCQCPECQARRAVGQAPTAPGAH